MKMDTVETIVLIHMQNHLACKIAAEIASGIPSTDRWNELWNQRTDVQNEIDRRSLQTPMGRAFPGKRPSWNHASDFKVTLEENNDS